MHLVILVSQQDVMFMVKYTKQNKKRHEMIIKGIRYEEGITTINSCADNTVLSV